MNTVQAVTMEPQPFAAAVSSNFSFTCSSFAVNMGTLVVRQMGDAWDKPFAVIYEPHFGAAGGTVQNASTLLRSNLVVG